MPPGKFLKVHVLKLHFRALSVNLWQAQSSSVLNDFTVAMHACIATCIRIATRIATYS